MNVFTTFHNFYKSFYKHFLHIIFDISLFFSSNCELFKLFERWYIEHSFVLVFTSTEDKFNIKKLNQHSVLLNNIFCTRRTVLLEILIYFRCLILWRLVRYICEAFFINQFSLAYFFLLFFLLDACHRCITLFVPNSVFGCQFLYPYTMMFSLQWCFHAWITDYYPCHTAIHGCLWILYGRGKCLRKKESPLKFWCAENNATFQLRKC